MVMLQSGLQKELEKIPLIRIVKSHQTESYHLELLGLKLKKQKQLWKL